MSGVSIGTGKVVVDRAMSLDGFIAGPGHAMGWIAEYLTADAFPEVMAATGARQGQEKIWQQERAS
jgi:hypothetical protein